MNSHIIASPEVTFDQVLNLAQRLRPSEQLRLIARLAPKVESVLDHAEAATPSQSHIRLRGLLADLGSAPSPAEIDEVQHEMWATFAQDEV